jgi:hypothetical protein
MTRPQSDHDYYARRQCSPQWRPFLVALAQELGSHLDAEGARALMRRLGTSIAQAHPLPSSELLPELETAMNTVWSGMDWGWVELNDTGTALQIVHHCAPIEAAFGAAGRPWAPAVLEGAYEQWLRAAGAGQRLKVRQAAGTAPPTDLTTFVFALAI